MWPFRTKPSSPTVKHPERCPACGWLSTYKIPHSPTCQRIDLASAIHHLRIAKQWEVHVSNNQQFDRRERQRGADRTRQPLGRLEGIVRRGLGGAAAQLGASLRGLRPAGVRRALLGLRAPLRLGRG